jgi:hypothetical protein
MHKVIQIIYDCIHSDIFRRFVAVVKEIARAAAFQEVLFNVSAYEKFGVSQI